MALTIWHDETKEVPFQVAGTDLAFAQPLNPSLSALTCGFVLGSAGGDPPTTWYAGNWDANTVDNIYYGMVLVGPSPGVVQLARGVWTVWAHFALGQETIQQPVLDTLYVR